MKNSEIIEKLKEHVEKFPITLDIKDEDRKITDPNEDQVNKAYIKLCDIWNGTDQSRNFLKHLIQSFLPINMNNRIKTFSEEEIQNDQNRCCILGIKMAGLDDIVDKMSEYLNAKLAIVNKAAAENREMTDKEARTLKRKFYSLPIEVQHATQALKSDTSKKYLSLEANLALNQFTQDAIMNGEKEIEFIIRRQYNKSHGETKKDFTKKPKKKGYKMETLIDEDTLNKLKNLK